MNRWATTAGENLWGRRGLVKSNGVFLPLGFLATAAAAPDTATDPATVAAVWWATVCWSTGCILINDLADARQDAIAGRRHWISSLPRAAGIAVVAVLLAAALALTALTGGIGPAAVCAAAVAVGTAYSIRPFRLKERGAFGPAAYALSAMLADAVVPWAWLGGSAGSLAVLAPAVFLDKWINLHAHQVGDREGDRAAGVVTYAVRAGTARARRSLRGFEIAACAAMLAVLTELARRPAGAGAAAAAIGMAAAVAAAIAFRYRGARGSSPTRELSRAYLGLTWAVFRVVPAILFVCLAWRRPEFWSTAVGVAVMCAVETAQHAVPGRGAADKWPATDGPIPPRAEEAQTEKPGRGRTGRRAVGNSRNMPS